MGIFVDKEHVLSSYSFGLAANPAQRLSALQLRQAVYARKGILDDRLSTELYIPNQAFLPGSAMFVAVREGNVTATLSVYADSELGLPMEEVHPTEVEMMRRRVPRLVEISGLAIEDVSRKSRIILFLFYYAFQWCLRCQFDGAVICVHPSSMRVYSSLLRFEILGPEIKHPRFKLAPSLPLGLDFRTAKERFQHYYNRASGKMNLFTFFFTDSSLPINIPDQSSAIMSQWTKEEVQTLASSISDRARKLIAVSALAGQMSNISLGGATSFAGCMADAIAAWRLAIGDGRVSDDVRRFAADTSSWSNNPAVVLRPHSIEHVQDIVRIAQRLSVPIYPVSTGHNWGYGTAVPACDCSAIVDLTQMNRILEFDRELGIVALEPGVTQSDLSRFLHENGLPFMTPVTGAGPSCSIVANALERGFGITPASDHFSAVLSLEAVLPDGTLYQSAFRQDQASGLVHPYKWGIGPYLDGLFSQSGMGVVVNMTIALATTPETVGAFLFSLKSSDLEKIIQPCREIMTSAGGTIGGLNIVSRDRVNAMLAGAARVESIARGAYDQTPGALSGLDGDWIGFGSLYGSKLHYRATQKLLKDRLTPTVQKLRFLDRRRLTSLRWVHRCLTRLKVAHGYPSLEQLSGALDLIDGIPSSVALRLAYARAGRPTRGDELDPAKDGCGLIWYSPIIPMRAGLLDQFMRMAVPICRSYHLDAPITLTAINSRYFAATLPLLFDPADDEQSKCASECYATLVKTGNANGFYPYRVGTQFMEALVDPDLPYWRVGASLKAGLDPGGILAPGRYNSIIPQLLS